MTGLASVHLQIVKRLGSGRTQRVHSLEAAIRLVVGCALVWWVASFLETEVSAGLYPIAPGPSTTVELEDWMFLAEAPEGHNYCADQAIGNNYTQHPGAFCVGWPPPDSYFVGVFSPQLVPYLKQPGGNLYLWETGFTLGPGPRLQLGVWNWTTRHFTGVGDVEVADYWATGENGVASSKTLFSEFNIGDHQVNAVRISFNIEQGAHNQVTAVAFEPIPEPGTAALFALGLSGWTWWGWSRRTRRWRS